MAGRNVQYVKQDEPSFLKDFKQKVGYKEGPDINTKREIATPNFDEDDDESVEKDDEKPVIVVLKDGDLTAAEAEQATKDKEFLTDDGKVKFKKPVKRSSESELNVTSKKKKDGNKEKDSTDKKDNDKTKKVKNTSLLSFGDDEEEEDDED